MTIGNILFYRTFFIALTILVAFFSLPYSSLAADSTMELELVSSPQERMRVYDLNGYISTKYVFRSTDYSGGNASDQDFYEQLRLDLTMPQDKKYEIHFFGYSRQDIDGNQNKTSFYPFEDIADARSNNIIGYLYEAHFDINDLSEYFTQLRVGRQTGHRDEPILFDGLAVEINPAQNLHLTLYGGISVHQDEINSDWGSDRLVGLGIDYSPHIKTLLSLDYLYVQDDRDLFSESDQYDQLFSFKIRQRITRFLRTMAKFSSMNGSPRDMKIRALNTFPELDIDVSVGYSRQFRTQKELSNEFSYYYDVMGEFSRYQSFDFKVRKLFGEHYAVDLGYFKRDILGDPDENTFNDDYTRIFAVFGIYDLLYKGLSLSLTGEYWDTDDNDFRSAGFDLAYTFRNRKKNTNINIGTYYSLNKYDYYVERGQRDEVQTYYVKANIPVGGHYLAHAMYEFEDTLEDYHTVKVGLRYDF